jgi:hypothetical protein
VCENVKKSLKIHYLVEDPLNAFDSGEYDKIIKTGVTRKVILLPSSNEQSEQFNNELEKLEKNAGANEEVVITRAPVGSVRNTTQEEIILFGNPTAVKQVKIEIENVIETYSVRTFKLTLLKQLQASHPFLFCLTSVFTFVFVKSRWNIFSLPVP